MAESKLKIDVRRNKILEQLRADGKVSVSRLAAQLGATPVTIRNDLTALERDGYLVRMQGGAVISHRLENHMAPETEDATFLRKQALAAEVAQLISDGQTLFFNSGTTTHHIARALKGKKHLNIVTNSLAIAMELGNTPTFHVLLLGGEINASYGFTSGGDTQEQLSKYRADWAILSVDGVSAQGGITTCHPEEAILDRLMMANARKVLIAATGNKIGTAGFSRICDSDETIQLVTDSTCDKDALMALQERGVRIVKV